MKELDEAKKDDEDEDDDSDDEDDDDGSDDTDDDKDDKDDSDDDDSDNDDSDDEDEDKDKKKSKKSKEKSEDDDDNSDDDNKDDTDDDDEDDKDSKDKTDDDADGVTEGIVIGSVPPDEFYATTVKVFTDLYKKSPGNNASDTIMKISKGARVNIQDYRKVKATGKKTFTRIVNISVDDGAKILKANGFKQGTAKILGYGLFFVKKLKEGYIEARVAEAYKGELGRTYMGGSMYSDGSYGGSTGTAYNYIKQCQVTVWYRKKASGSMRDRYTIESTGEVIGKTSMQIQLEQLTIEKMERDLRKSHAGSVFEALVMFDRVGVEQDALMEGVSVDLDKTMNAAMLEAIMQYTVIETLNTMGVCNLTSVNTSSIRKALMEDMNVMSADKNNSSKKTRINTMKYKRNRDDKVVAQNSAK